MKEGLEEEEYRSDEAAENGLREDEVLGDRGTVFGGFLACFAGLGKIGWRERAGGKEVKPGDEAEMEMGIN